MEEQGLEAAIRSFQDWELPATSLVSLSMHWTVQDWEEPRVLLTVGLRDAPDQPLLEDSAIREKMVDRAAEVYDVLAPRIGIQNLCMYYSYWGVQDQNGSPLSYRADVSVPDGAALSREDVISGVSAAV